MEAKGTIIESLVSYINVKFGKDNYDKWLETLLPEAKEVFSKPILVSDWYPLTKILTEPTQRMCDMFYDGNLKGAWENGRYSAEQRLKGIYKVFVKIGSPHHLISKGSSVMSTHYRPSAFNVVKSSSNSAVARITEFPEISKVIEYRISGWIERALEISGCKNLVLKINTSIADGGAYTEFEAKWD